MLDLWSELQGVRKQFSDLKAQTEADLEQQRNDFTRVFRSLQGITKSVSGGDVGFLNNNFYSLFSYLFRLVC